MQIIHNHGYNEYNEYNFNLLISEFKKFLQINGKSRITIKNYLSDLRFFFGWINTVLGLQPKLESLKAIDGAKIKEYKKYLLESGLPSSSINRRLSSLRTFFISCIENKILTINPCLNLTNVTRDHLPMQKQQNLNPFIQTGIEFLNSDLSDIPEEKRTSLQNDIYEFLAYLGTGGLVKP